MTDDAHGLPFWEHLDARQRELVLRARDDNAQVSKTTPVRTADLRGKSAPVEPRVHAPVVVRVVERKPVEPQKVTIIRRTSKSEESLPGDSTGAKR